MCASFSSQTLGIWWREERKTELTTICARLLPCVGASCRLRSCHRTLSSAMNRRILDPWIEVTVAVDVLLGEFMTPKLACEAPLTRQCDLGGDGSSPEKAGVDVRATIRSLTMQRTPPTSSGCGQCRSERRSWGVAHYPILRRCAPIPGRNCAYPTNP
jgi:hypothetical protein